MTKHIAIGVVAGFVVGVLLAPQVLPSSFIGKNMMSARSGWMTGNVIDAHFIEQMIPHHEDAITMATMALARGGTRRD